MADQLFHIAWTTFEEYPIGDSRGSWQKIKDLYSNLEHQQIGFQLSEEFPEAYRSKEPRVNRVVFSPKTIEQLQTILEELCVPGKDRVISGLKLEMACVHETHVELLVYCEPVSLKQKVSRLKSRAATLLGFHSPESHAGKNTWGKGIWTAQLFNPTASAVSTIQLSMKAGKE